jgi:lipoprotein-releasing system permease protein
MFPMPYELFIAKRYLGTRRKTGFINIITYISVIGVTIGVAALIIVLSVMNGFESEVRSRIIGFDAHLRIRGFYDQGISDWKGVSKEIQDVDHIAGMSPYILDKGMLRCIGSAKSGGVIIRGADQTNINEVSDLENNIVEGYLELGPAMEENGREIHGIVVGRALADQLSFYLGDRVLIMSLAGVRTAFSDIPMKQFVVTGIYETGFFEYDNALVYISIESAQQLFRFGEKVSGIEIRLDDLNKASLVKNVLLERLKLQHRVLTWFEMRPNLFSWMQYEKWGAFIILCLIILVAAMNIISTMIMVTMEKTKEIGILKSMGATARSITRIFLYEGIIVGFSGTFLGFAIGFILCKWQQIKPFFKLDGEVYFISSLPVKMHGLDFLFIGTASVLICLLAAIYPARKASKLIPVDAIRYE